MPREKSRYRDRRSSSYSSDSSYERKKSKSKHRRHSRSREVSVSSSHRRRRSSSRSRRRRSYSRSVSRDRHEKSRRRSTSRTRSRRDRSHSRSSSHSRSKRKSKKSHRRSRSSSRSSSFDIGNSEPSSEDLSSILDALLNLNIKSKKKPFFSKRPLPPKPVNLDDTESKVEKAIKAAAAAGLTMTKIPTYEYKEVEIKEDMPTIHDRNLLAELNSDVFIQKSFKSSRNKKETKNIVIDLDTNTVKLPEVELKQKSDSIINFEAIPGEEDLKEMWIKKLYQYRKRMLKGEL